MDSSPSPGLLRRFPPACSPRTAVRRRRRRSGFGGAPAPTRRLKTRRNSRSRAAAVPRTEGRPARAPGSSRRAPGLHTWARCYTKRQIRFRPKCAGNRRPRQDRRVSASGSQKRRETKRGPTRDSTPAPRTPSPAAPRARVGEEEPRRRGAGTSRAARRPPLAPLARLFPQPVSPGSPSLTRERSSAPDRALSRVKPRHPHRTPPPPTGPLPPPSAEPTLNAQNKAISYPSRKLFPPVARQGKETRASGAQRPHLVPALQVPSSAAVPPRRPGAPAAVPRRLLLGVREQAP